MSELYYHSQQHKCNKKMNIFFIENHPQQIAESQCNRHASKMILETIQMLSSAHHLYGNKDNALTECLSKSHLSHPSTKWILNSKANYVFAYNLLSEMMKEFNRRFNHVYESYHHKYELLKNIPNELSDRGLTENINAQAMPIEFKSKDTIQSYRNYYINKKINFADWHNRLGPMWFYEHTNNTWLEDNIFILNRDLIILTSNLNKVINKIANRKNIKNRKLYVQNYYKNYVKTKYKKDVGSFHLLEQLDGDRFISSTGYEYNLFDHFSLI